MEQIVFSDVVKATCSLASPLLPFIQLELVRAQGESTEGIYHILCEMTLTGVCSGMDVRYI